MFADRYRGGGDTKPCLYAIHNITHFYESYQGILCQSMRTKE